MALSDQDVEHVRRGFATFNATERADEAAIRAHHARFYDPDVEIVNADGWPIPGSYRGTEGYVSWYQESYGPYEDVRYAVDSIDAVGERVVALVTISGRPRGEETELEVQLGLVYGMRGGKIAKVELYLGHERALQAARATA
jgi:ketosteroid isomerase-like protein